MIAALACFTFRGASTGLKALLMLIVCGGDGDGEEKGRLEFECLGMKKKKKKKMVPKS